MNTALVPDLVARASASQGFFFKYISANDAGTTGAHQAGFYMPRDSWSLFLERPGEKGENRHEWIDVSWPQDQTQTRSRFIWYGRAQSKSEYRLTNGFSFLSDEHVGDLLVLVRQARSQFTGYRLSRDEDIEEFLEAFSLSPEDAYRLQQTEAAEESLLHEYATDWLAREAVQEFPGARSFSEGAREFVHRRSGSEEIVNPDERLLSYLDAEFRLFKVVERKRYARYLERPFESVEKLIDTANTILNRRKSRSGLALENHLAYLFTKLRRPFAHQETTEGRSRPDFLFPSVLHYRDTTFPPEGLAFLGVKTTCKDRWRQILNEAERIPQKHLFTLQQGISEAQLEEMESSQVRLVVPEPYRRHFPKRFRGRILSLGEFIARLPSLSPTSSG